MKVLETKIPPLLMVVIFIAIMWLMDSLIPAIEIPSLYATALCVLILITGLMFSILGVLGFRQAQTTVDPTKPEKSSSLVTQGVYQYSRNPMYVGFLCFILAWALFLNNLWLFLFGWLFVPYMNRFQIRVEEDVLLKIFGQEYQEYMNKVRRWL